MKQSSDYDHRALAKFTYQLLGLDLQVYCLDTQDKTNTWSKPNKDKQYNQNLIFQFIEDIKRGRKNYRYYFDGFGCIQAYHEIEILLDTSLTYNISHELQLNLYDLVGEQHHLRKMIVGAMDWENTELLMSLLKKKFNYENIDGYDLDKQIELLEACYYIIMKSKKFTTKNVVESFIYHAKEGQISLEKVDLGGLFLKLFSKSYIDLFYDAFDIQKQAICTNIEMTYSMIHLSIQQLNTCFIEWHYLIDMAQLVIDNNVKFPLFQVLEQKGDVIPLLFENKTGHAQKITLLFEQYIEQHILFKDNQKLMEIMEQINEKVDLENSLKKEVKNLNHIIKI
jgi:hypothetical protein